MDGAYAELSCTACRRLKRKCSKDLPTCALCKRVRRRCGEWPLKSLLPHPDAGDRQSVISKTTILGLLARSALLLKLAGLTPMSAEYPTPTSSPDGQLERQGSWPQSDPSKSPRIPSFNQLASFASLSQRNEVPPSLKPKQLAPDHFAKKFPVWWYLDSIGSKGMTMTIPTDLEWLEVATFAVETDQARLIADRYFETAHSWLPTISQTRLRRTLTGTSTACEPADLAALIVAMDLLSESEVLSRSISEQLSAEEHVAPGDLHRSRGGIYRSLKAVLSALEERGQFTTNFLGAQVLTAAYEMGQALYPAAYFTVGACVRICHTMGLHNRRLATQLRARTDTWNETEERRRLWWSSIVLDRMVSVGFMYRPLAVPSIPPNEIIPGNDDMWDAGDLSASPVLIMSIESQTKVSPFARTCQAAHLLGRVCDHVNEHNDPTDIDFHFQEARSIQRAGEALLNMVREEMRSDGTAAHRLFGAMGLCCSALLSIYGVHSCIEIDPMESTGRNRGARVEMQQMGLDGYRRIASIILEFAGDIHSAPIEKVSPLVLHCVYEAACCYAWIFRENGSESQLAGLQGLRMLLKAVEPRWPVAGESLQCSRPCWQRRNGKSSIEHTDADCV